jgi:hypothetical protein
MTSSGTQPEKWYGRQLTLRTYHGTHLQVFPGSSAQVNCVAGEPSLWSQFVLECLGHDRRVHIRTHHGSYLRACGATPGSTVEAVDLDASQPTREMTWTIEADADTDTWYLKSYAGTYLRVALAGDSARVDLASVRGHYERFVAEPVGGSEQLAGCTVNILSAYGTYLRGFPDGRTATFSERPCEWEEFFFERSDDSSLALRSFHGSYLQIVRRDDGRREAALVPKEFRGGCTWSILFDESVPCYRLLGRDSDGSWYFLQAHPGEPGVVDVTAVLSDATCLYFPTPPPPKGQSLHLADDSQLVDVLPQPQPAAAASASPAVEVPATTPSKAPAKDPAPATASPTPAKGEERPKPATESPKTKPGTAEPSQPSGGGTPPRESGATSLNNTGRGVASPLSGDSFASGDGPPPSTTDTQMPEDGLASTSQAPFDSPMSPLVLDTHPPRAMVVVREEKSPSPPPGADEPVPCYMCGFEFPTQLIAEHHARCERSYHKALDNFAKNPLCGLFSRGVAPPMPPWAQAKDAEQAAVWRERYRDSVLRVLNGSIVMCRGCEVKYAFRDIGPHFDECKREAAGRVPGCPLVVRFSPQRIFRQLSTAQSVK